MEINIHFKETWWWKPALKTIYVATVCRLISLSMAEKLANLVVRNAFKWRIGKKWRKITDIQVSVERQGYGTQT